MTICRWSPDMGVAEITQLLHAAYAPLADMGFRYLATHQDDAMTFQRLSVGRAYLAFMGDRLAGTISLREPDAANDCAYYRQPGVHTFGQFAVAPDMQRQGIGRSLLGHVEKAAASSGALELALDTAEGALHLIQWYQRQGYQPVGHVSWHDTNYRSLVMSKSLNGVLD